MSPVSKTLVVELPVDLVAQIEGLAAQRRQSPQDVVNEACRAHLAAVRAQQHDDEYARGYTETPEEVSDLEALLPHLPLPQEKW